MHPRGTPRSGQGRAPPGKCRGFSNFCSPLRCRCRSAAAPAAAPAPAAAAAAGLAGETRGAGASEGEGTAALRAGTSRGFAWGSGGLGSCGIRAEVRLPSGVPSPTHLGALPQAVRGDVAWPWTRVCFAPAAGEPLAPCGLSGGELWSSVTCPGNFYQGGRWWPGGLAARDGVTGLRWERSGCPRVSPPRPGRVTPRGWPAPRDEAGSLMSPAARREVAGGAGRPLRGAGSSGSAPGVPPTAGLNGSAFPVRGLGGGGGQQGRGEVWAGPAALSDVLLSRTW